VVDGDAEAAFARHLRICRLLNSYVARADPGPDKRACEIGCGDCLSTADLLLGAGFGRVYLVEKQPIVLNGKQRAILDRLKSLGELPNAGDCVVEAGGLAIDEDRVKIVPEYFEDALLPERVDLLFSHDVVEHVEDLPGFFGKCAEFLNGGGIMVHKFDLSGHEFFEDPLPPLDFQTYPDWLYEIMFPRYRRACRWFLKDIQDAMTSAGFHTLEVHLLRSADTGYLHHIRPLLRGQARALSDEELAPLDIVIVSQKA